MTFARLARVLVALAVALSLASAAPDARAQAPKAAETALVGDLVLLRGRLIAARELYLFVHDKDAAMRHLGSQLNGRIASIERNGGRPSDAKAVQAAVGALTKVVEAGGGFNAFEAAYGRAMAATIRAEGAVPKDRLASPAFVIAVLAEVVDHAAGDYKVAVKDGKIGILKEYEEIFGYDIAAVRFARRLGGKGGPLASPRMREDLAMLERAVPSPVPPTSFATTQETFSAIAERLKAAAKS